MISELDEIVLTCDLHDERLTAGDIGTVVLVPEQGRDDLVQSGVGHACEWETSMMLAIRPDLVKPFQSLENRDVGYSFEPAYRG